MCGILVNIEGRVRQGTDKSPYWTTSPLKKSPPVEAYFEDMKNDYLRKIKILYPKDLYPIELWKQTVLRKDHTIKKNV